MFAPLHGRELKQQLQRTIQNKKCRELESEKRWELQNEKRREVPAAARSLL
jgi:hypothetical protein